MHFGYLTKDEAHVLVKKLGKVDEDGRANAKFIDNLAPYDSHDEKSDEQHSQSGPSTVEDLQAKKNISHQDIIVCPCHANACSHDNTRRNCSSHEMFFKLSASLQNNSVL